MQTCCHGAVVAATLVNLGAHLGFLSRLLPERTTEVGCRAGSILSTVCSLAVGSPVVKKGRHRRFEEARKLKQSGPGAFDLGLGDRSPVPASEEDEYAALAEKYGVEFDDEDDEIDD
jgi:hypothetical protein